MKFKVEIKLGNSAMCETEHLIQAVERLAGSLRDCGDVVRDAAEGQGWYGYIRDNNGNVVGSWAVEP